MSVFRINDELIETYDSVKRIGLGFLTSEAFRELEVDDLRTFLLLLDDVFRHLENATTFDELQQRLQDVKRTFGEAFKDATHEYAALGRPTKKKEDMIERFRALEQRFRAIQGLMTIGRKSTETQADLNDTLLDSLESHKKALEELDKRVRTLEEVNAQHE